ncbi:MAG TPA: tyrosine/phenylalanine carboxypeptidase domain-containing protein, partial [Stenotrophomonas sp.]|nr:tyrosine/phenylalanine carboxypeptidase domain-containing protein [Stenotrophomonas sp.]
IFRGGDVRGRICFTKDGAYLEGLLLVTAFVKRALHENRGDTLRLLFCGRVTLGDLIALAAYRESGLVAAPHYLPPWARHPERVLATLAFSTAAQGLRLDSFELERFAEYEDEIIAGA